MPGLITIFLIIITISAYLFSRFLYFKYQNPFVNIVLLSTSMVIAILVLGDIPYQAYVPGQDIMTLLLGPATVGLAVPLYRNRHLLRQYGLAICLGVGVGTVISMMTVLLITQAGGLPREVIISIIPKSSSTPFAIEIARMSGGDPALSAVFVIVTGTFVSILGLPLLTRFKITHAVARGSAMGTVAHGQGTAMALLEGGQQGSMSGVAMGLAGVFTSVLTPVMVVLLL